MSGVPRVNKAHKCVLYSCGNNIVTHFLTKCKMFLKKTNNFLLAERVMNELLLSFI